MANAASKQVFEAFVSYIWHNRVDASTLRSLVFSSLERHLDVVVVYPTPIK